MGPRSLPARRELKRVLNSVASSPLGVVVTVLTADVTAMTIAGLILIQMPPTWPLSNPPAIDVHVSGFDLDRFHI